jgi:hypothetical protein
MAVVTRGSRKVRGRPIPATLDDCRAIARDTARRNYVRLLYLTAATPCRGSGACTLASAAALHATNVGARRSDKSRQPQTNVGTRL